MHRLSIDNLAIGQTQLGNEVSGTDKTIWWSNPSIWEIGGDSCQVSPETAPPADNSIPGTINKHNSAVIGGPPQR